MKSQLFLIALLCGPLAGSASAQPFRISQAAPNRNPLPLGPASSL